MSRSALVRSATIDRLRSGVSQEARVQDMTPFTEALISGFTEALAGTLLGAGGRRLRPGSGGS